MQAEKCCAEALMSRQVQQLTLVELEPEERRLVARARSMSHASALLSLLGIEIALKGYQIRDCGGHTHTHDLQHLFDSLKSETKSRLEEIGPEVSETLSKHRKGFVSLRYQFEDSGDSRPVVIPRPSDPLHSAAMSIVEALIREPGVQQVAARAGSRAKPQGGGHS